MDIFSVYILSVVTSSLMLNANYRLIEERLKNEQYIEKNEKFSNTQKLLKLTVVLIPGVNIIHSVHQTVMTEKNYEKMKLEIIKNIQKERISDKKEEKESEKVIKLRDKLKTAQHTEVDRVKKLKK